MRAQRQLTYTEILNLSGEEDWRIGLATIRSASLAVCNREKPYESNRNASIHRTGWTKAYSSSLTGNQTRASLLAIYNASWLWSPPLIDNLREVRLTLRPLVDNKAAVAMGRIIVFNAIANKIVELRPMCDVPINHALGDDQIQTSNLHYLPHMLGHAEADAELDLVSDAGFSDSLYASRSR